MPGPWQSSRSALVDEQVDRDRGHGENRDELVREGKAAPQHGEACRIGFCPDEDQGAGDEDGGGIGDTLGLGDLVDVEALAMMSRRERSAVSPR